MSQPEPCISGYCRSPVACGGFGYCRDRNRDGVPGEVVAKEWRERAKKLNTKHPNGAPMFDAEGAMLDHRGNRIL